MEAYTYYALKDTTKIVQLPSQKIDKNSKLEQQQFLPLSSV